MTPATELAVFWVAFAVISGWVLSQYYFSKDATLAHRLRIIACGAEVATLGLLALSSLRNTPDALPAVVALFALVLVAGALLLTTNSLLLKTAATLHFLATGFVFALMIRVFPSTMELAPGDIVLVAAILCMLINTVVVLLLWHRLQKAGTSFHLKNTSPLFIVLGLLVVILATLLFLTPREGMALFHSRNSFTLSYPMTWVADASMKEAPAEFIREPGGKAFFSMQLHEDIRIKYPARRPSMYRDIESAYANDPRYQIQTKEWESPDKTIAENSYFVSGVYTEEGVQWQFKELAITTKSGFILILRGASPVEYGDSYWPALDRIFASVQPTKDWALAEVRALPEIKDFSALLARSDKIAQIEIDGEGSDWAVHVYEVVNDGTSTHTATYGWYHLDQASGAMVREE